MHNPVTRKLVNETHNIFSMLQGQVASSTGQHLQSQLVLSSKQYRAVLKACSMELIHLAETTRNEQQKQKCEEQLEIFEMIQLIWGFCQILFIEITPDGLLLNQLLDWIKWHFTEGKQLAVEVIHDDLPAQHPAYWEATFRLLLQGEIDSVRKLLSLNESFQNEAFLSVDELLRKMPQWTHYHHALSAAEFDMKWRHWREECQRRYEEGHYSAFPDLETLVMVLCGDENVFSDIKDMCGTWYHLLVSKMLFQNPTVRAADLHFYAETCIEEFNMSGSRMGELDNILLAAIQFDIHQVIKDSSVFLSTGSWWFVAHITDLLHHCGQLDTQNLPYGSNLREFLILEYATSLMSHKSLWQVGIDYLDYCTVFGRTYVKQFINHMVLDNEKKAQKLLHICQERNLQDEVQTICKVMGMKSLRLGRLGSALAWFLRSKDVTATSKLTERLIEDYSICSKFQYTDILDNLGPAMFLSNRLTFLVKYREFHKLYEKQETPEAASLLLSLLEARLAPRTFWITLLQDAMPLLEMDKVIFSSSQTYVLMHCLEELRHELDSKTDISKKLTNMEKDKLDLLQLCLTRNLSKAIKEEGTIKSS
ncbi:hypothetical protein LOTGIDRAFT_221230 [Lottia gigantea]|uniref:Nuclear pore complex protein Nup85 n=1 Tax=Lottia gigantea TaxID=225164 RepID=V4B9V2_LOTGI|nr:hypothetical protein LOTGIDRAFT_221230 [Lottia gigantea]ESO85789.1 hypothetical protein LOTGIDRAFT_221230 [Lottia gigantea]